MSTVRVRCLARLLPLVLGMGLPAGPAAAQLQGNVVDARSGVGVAAAVVRVTGPVQRAVTTDGSGGYAFTGLAAGEYSLTAAHAGYDSTRVHVVVRAGGAVTVDLRLTPRPVRMASLPVDTERQRDEALPGGGADTAGALLSAQRLRLAGPRTAGALGDLAGGGGTGAAPPDHPGGRQPHALFIWGSGGERGRVLLDGAALNAPLHLGAILPPLDPELLGRADLRTAGISPRYDGGTTYIMDFGTRPADARTPGSTGSVDLLSSTGTLELPLGAGAGLLAGARRVNSEVVESLAGRRFGYGYSDAIARADLAPGGARGTVTAIRTREAVRLPRDQGEDEAAWQNIAVAASLQGPSPDGVVASGSWSRGTADLPLLSAPGGHTRGTADRAAASLERRSGATLLGVEAEHLRFERVSSADSDPLDPRQVGPVRCTRLLPCESGSITLLAAYAEAAWQPWRQGAARAGLRAAWEPGGARLHLLPRVSVTALAGATRSVTLSVGRFSQAVHEAAAGRSPLVAHATQAELTLAQRSRGVALSASAFLRHQERLDSLPSLAAPGAEVSVAHSRGGGSLALGYSLLGRRGADDPSAVEYQQLFAATAGLRHGAVRVDVGAAYGRGLPLTTIVLERAVLPTPPPMETAGHSRQRSSLRLDVLLSGEWRLQRDGRVFRVLPYARLVNGLRRRDALFYYDDGALPGEPQPLGALPALPVLGVSWHF